MLGNVMWVINSLFNAASLFPATTNHSLGFLSAFEMIEDVLMDGNSIASNILFSVHF
jgi:hypothetical protein